MSRLLGAIVFALLVVWGLWSNWIQYRSHCPHGECFFHTGEAFSAIYTAICYQRFGARYWFLQQLPLFGDQFDCIDRPFLIYTHNPNLGGFVVYAATLLGFDTIIAPALVTAVAYAAGIYLAFRFGEAATGSRAWGNWFGLFMATDVLYNLSWGLNLLRGWHWLAIFATWLAVIRLAQGDGRRYAALLAFGCLTTFMLGLDFSTVIAACAVALALAFGDRWRRGLLLSGTVAGLFGLLFALRQIQIIGGVGAEIWMTDLTYTFGLKIPREIRWFEIPDEQAIGAWYQAHQIGRGGTGAYSLSDQLDYAQFARNLNTWRHLQLIAPLFVVGAMCLLVNLVRRDPSSLHGVRACLALLMGTAVGSTLFFGQFWSYFVRLGFPFLAALIYLALAIAVGSLVDVCKLAGRRMMLAACTIVILLWTGQQAVNATIAPPEQYPYLLRVVPGHWRLCIGPAGDWIACSD